MGRQQDESEPKGWRWFAPGLAISAWRGESGRSPVSLVQLSVSSQPASLGGFHQITEEEPRPLVCLVQPGPLWLMAALQRSR